jgi:hypothetical protein
MKPYNSNILKADKPPISEILSWLEQINLSSKIPLLDVSQAAPAKPPPLEMRSYLSKLILDDPTVHLYGPILGLQRLRSVFAEHLNSFYETNLIDFDNIGITSGCNQAFGATIATLAKAGDEVIIPTPWYFNHKMWLDIFDIKAISLTSTEKLLPDVKLAQKLITDKTKAIILVSPNNPTGIEYPKKLIRDFYELCVKNEIQLIIDETYKDFNITNTAPHELFSKIDWVKNYTLLYSFSKVFHLTGHRIGAVVTSKERLVEIEKYLDSSTICPSQIGQRAALYGLEKLKSWVAKQRDELLLTRKEIENRFKLLEPKGWKLAGLGAYFAYLEHPFNMNSKVLAKRLLENKSILTVPGTLFFNKENIEGERFLRIAFANIDRKDIKILFERLQSFTP